VLPGKKYTIEAIARIAVRRAWIIAVSLGLCTAAAVVVSKRLPNQFRSETLIMLMPQRIPDSYVKSAVTGKIEDQLNSIEDQILSRSRLERIILDLSLYSSLRRTLPMEDVVQRMRDDIGPIRLKARNRFASPTSATTRGPLKDDRAACFSIHRGERPRPREPGRRHEPVLNAQLEDARRQLKEHEKKLEEYRTRFGGEMPSQVGANLQAVQTCRSAAEPRRNHRSRQRASPSDRAADRRPPG